MAGSAVRLTTLKQTGKRPDMFTCELDVASLEALVKAAKVAQLPKVKFLGFMGTAESGKEFMDILAEPCAPYVRAGESQREPTAPPTHW